MSIRAAPRPLDEKGLVEEDVSKKRLVEKRLVEKRLGRKKKPGPREPGLGIGHVRPTQSPSKRDY
jgi:hypothetical protein